MNKFAPKNVKLCPGCPPKEITPITGPKFSFTPPQQKSSKTVTMVDMSKYKKKHDTGGKQNTLF